MQYTLRNIPQRLDRVLRRQASEQGKSLNQVAIEAMMTGSGLQGERVRRRDLSDIAGTWVADPEVDKALEDQRRIDPDLWK